MEFASRLATVGTSTVRGMRALVRALRGDDLADDRRLTDGVTRTYGQHLRAFLDDDDLGAEVP